MFFGTPTFTLLHVVISLVGIVAGFVIVYGLFTGKSFRRWNLLFITTTLATSITGFLFPVERFLPSHAVGIVSVVVLALAIVALYAMGLSGRWREIYAVTALIAFYLNLVVLAVQLFLKIPILRALAPKQTDLPFVFTQLVLLVVFIGLGTRALFVTKSQTKPALGSTLV
jgi:hypothetical protein